MQVLHRGHRYALNHRKVEGAVKGFEDTVEKTIVQYINTEPGHECSGVTQQELLRMMIDRNRYCTACMPDRVSADIEYHLRMALVLHESRALERKVKKGELAPEYVMTGDDGHFELGDKSIYIDEGDLDSTELAPYVADKDLRSCNHHCGEPIVIKEPKSIVGKDKKTKELPKEEDYGIKPTDKQILYVEDFQDLPTEGYLIVLNRRTCTSDEIKLGGSLKVVFNKFFIRIKRDNRMIYKISVTHFDDRTFEFYTRKPEIASEPCPPVKRAGKGIIRPTDKQINILSEIGDIGEEGTLIIVYNKTNSVYTLNLHESVSIRVYKEKTGGKNKWISIKEDQDEVHKISAVDFVNKAVQLYFREKSLIDQYDEGKKD